MFRLLAPRYRHLIMPLLPPLSARYRHLIMLLSPSYHAVIATLSCRCRHLIPLSPPCMPLSPSYCPVIATFMPLSPPSCRYRHLIVPLSPPLCRCRHLSMPLPPPYCPVIATLMPLSPPYCPVIATFMPLSPPYCPVRTTHRMSVSSHLIFPAFILRVNCPRVALSPSLSALSAEEILLYISVLLSGLNITNCFLRSLLRSSVVTLLCSYVPL